MKRSVMIAMFVAAGCGLTDGSVHTGDQPDATEESELCWHVQCPMEGSADAVRLLAVLSGASDAVLRGTYSLSTSQLRRVRAFTTGADGVPHSADDQRFTSIAQLRTATGFTCCTLARIADATRGCTTCRDDDGLCPTGCTQANDNDCRPPAPVCGNGKKEGSEVCDGDCPTSCDDQNACTTNTLRGSAAQCTASCRFDPITTCVSQDGCCPSGCTWSTDTDCAPVCGNGQKESTELCDGDCPTSCDDQNACTTNTLTGSAAQCTASCRFDAIASCISQDGCCPSGCTWSTDNDCAAVCGNGQKEATELCDGDCPTTCADQNACTTDVLAGSASQCNAACRFDPITTCVSSDGCCPAGCTFATDADCARPVYAIGQDAAMTNLYTDDDVVLFVNGTEVLRRSWQAQLSFTAVPGDWVMLRFYDTYGVSKRHGEVWLAGPQSPPQKVGDALVGGRNDYPARANFPFDIVVFQVPTPGGVAARGCMPLENLDYSWWPRSTYLAVQEATTQRYRSSWRIVATNPYGTWPADYDLPADCRGWVTSVFVTGAGWASVYWNAVTNQLRTAPVSGHAYNDSIARSCAQHSVNTLFPAGDMSMLSITY